MRTRGAIVNVSSVSSFASTPASVAYSASKGAVVSFTRALAVDHAADNVRCNCVAPGSIQTPLLESSADYFAPDDPTGAIVEWGRAHPLRRVGTPEEVARLITFLVSDDAAFCTSVLPHRWRALGAVVRYVNQLDRLVAHGVPW